MGARRAARRLYRGLAAVVVGLWALALRMRSPWGRTPDAPPRRVLLIRLGLIGDAVLLTPALRLLRDNYPDARIDVLVTPPQRELLTGLPSIDRLVTWDAGDLLEPRLALDPYRWRRARETLRALRDEHYDVALSCYGPLASAIALASGAPRRIGYAGEALPFTLTRALPGARWDRPWHDAEYNVECVRALGATGVTPPAELPAPSGEPPAALDALAPAGSPLVVLHTGAVNGRAKRWPFEHWRALVPRLRADGFRLLFVGAGEDDRAFARSVAHDGENLVGRTSLRELANVLARADVFVTADSGPMHIATALGRPVVAIFGPTDPVIYAPFQPERAIVVRHPVPCQPCYRLDRVADCPLGHTLCQRGLLPDRVHEAVRELLAETRA